MANLFEAGNIFQFNAQISPIYDNKRECLAAKSWYTVYRNDLGKVDFFLKDSLEDSIKALYD